MRRRHVVVLAAGAALSFGCGAKEAPPEQQNADPVGPEPVIQPPRNPPAQELPTWDEVPSGHPDGATNPPMPELVVTPQAVCYKRWVSPMKRPTGPRGNRVEDCTTDCGTRIECPPEAEELLAAWRAEQQGDEAGE